MISSDINYITHTLFKDTEPLGGKVIDSFRFRDEFDYCTVMLPSGYIIKYKMDFLESHHHIKSREVLETYYNYDK